MRLIRRIRSTKNIRRWACWSAKLTGNQVEAIFEEDKFRMYAYILAGIIIFLAGLIQGLSGFGFAIVAVPLLTLLFDIRTVVPLVALCSIIINLIIFHQLKIHFEYRKVFPLVIGSFFGIPIGIYFLKHYDEKFIGMILAAILLCYSAYSLLGKEIKFTLRNAWSYFIGIIAGSMGGAFNMNGPPVVIYASLKYSDKDKIKSMLASYFLSTGVLIILMHAVNGLTTAVVIKYFFLFVPVLVIGVLIGSRLYDRINQVLFKKVVYTLMLAMGFLLLLKCIL